MLPAMTQSAVAPSDRLPVVALDGPGSSGKSSVGAAAAARLGLRFCDTGLLYRAVTFAALRRGIGESDTERLVALVDAIRLEADAAGRYTTVTLDGDDVTAEVHVPEVDAAVSAYARVPALRSALLERQREIAAGGGIVMAGRDIGTVILPDAAVKLYLDAKVAERARRRATERGVAAAGPEAEEILGQLQARDDRDASRAVAPLRPAPGAIVIRTDGNTLETTVDLVVAAIRDGSRLGAVDAAGTSRAGQDRAKTRPARRPPTAPTPIATRVGFVIWTASFVMRFIAGLFTRVRIEGDLTAFPRHGAVLIAANHASNADPVLIGGFLNARLGRPINWMGKREVFEWPFISWLARRGGVHPVERGAADVEAFKTAMRILDGGNILAVFPEGTRSPDGRLQLAKDGVAVLAARSGATIVPIGVGDSDRLWPKGRRMPQRTPSVTVRIGRPFKLADAFAEGAGTIRPDDDPPAADRAGVASRRRSNAAGTDLIMRRIAALLPSRQRGAYGDDPAA